MSNYTFPDVHIRDVASGSAGVESTSTTIGMLIGTCRSGLLGEAQLVTSWTDFINKYANGLDTPFGTNHDLPYSVYGFFYNGGKELYVGRVASSSARCATATSETSHITVKAKYEGADGNKLNVVIKRGEDFTASTNEVYDVTVNYGNYNSVKLTEVTRDSFVDVLNGDARVSEWIEVSTGEIFNGLSEETIQLAGGNDGVSDINDTDYIKGLEMADTLEDVSFLGIPGQTSGTVNDAILVYCDNKQIFPILDAPVGSSPKAVKELRKVTNAFGGCLAYPWGKTNDPVTGKLRLTPTCGHIMGVYARQISERGVHKAPAGVDAVVRGFVAMERVLTSTEVGMLNPVGVVCVLPRANSGIVVWGARSLNNNADLRYVSDININYYIKKALYKNTQFAVFEPNNESLWSRVKATCEAILEQLRLDGGLKGDKESAYFVTVDSTNNTEASIKRGELNIKIGYAPVKPAEFVIIDLAHSMESN